AAANAVLDVMLKPGFFEHVQKMSLLLKQKLASVIDRYPNVLAEVRGEGLLIGVKAVTPSADLVTALRAQKLLTVGAGENVVRFLPPLIVNEAEIEESVARLERACATLSTAQTQRAAVQCVKRCAIFSISASGRSGTCDTCQPPALPCR